MGHPRGPCRGAQLGQEKQTRAFSRMDEKAPRMLLLMNQFHDIFEYLRSVIGHKTIVPNKRPASIVIFLY